MKKQNPESLEDVKKSVFKKTWNWLGKKSLRFKIALGLIAVIVLFALARINAFGEPFYLYARLILPVQISGIDPSQPVIPLSLNYEIENEYGRRGGKLGGAYDTGDHIFLSFRAGLSCWITVFGIDAKGIHNVFGDSLSPRLIEKDQTYTINFELDETVGVEIYYAIVASEKFNFEEEIKPHLENNFPEGHSKGPVFSNYELKLPSKFVQGHIYFNHLGISDLP